MRLRFDFTESVFYKIQIDCRRCDFLSAAMIYSDFFIIKEKKEKMSLDDMAISLYEPLLFAGS